jgi:NAD(P)-dependent dehydrogenase (short-subunit alcohol dehydrogenase family)
MTTTLVTGSSTGIGKATALRLASDGHRVIATMRTPDASDLGAVAKEQGLDLEIRALDVTDTASVNAVIGSVIAEHGGIDVLVNNAGIGDGGTIEETPLETFEAVMDTNFYGAIRCTKAVLPSMRERGGGCIVSVTSQAGRIGIPTLGPYCASKFALEAAMQSLAIEASSFGIRVALIEPGAILTPILGKYQIPDPESPYAPIQARFGVTAMHDFGRGSKSRVVADCIAEAIASGATLARIPVGQGAERNIHNRESMTDEEYVAAWNLPDEAEFIQLMLQGD